MQASVLAVPYINIHPRRHSSFPSYPVTIEHSRTSNKEQAILNNQIKPIQSDSKPPLSRNSTSNHPLTGPHHNLTALTKFPRIHVHQLQNLHLQLPINPQKPQSLIKRKKRRTRQRSAHTLKSCRRGTLEDGVAGMDLDVPSEEVQ